MVKPFSGLVLGSGALLGSPALYAALVDGTLPLSTAAVRLGVAVAVAWVGLSLLGWLISGTAEQVTDPAGVPRALPGPGNDAVQGTVLDAQDDPSHATPTPAAS